MDPLPEPQRHATLCVLTDVLIYLRSWTSGTDGVAPAKSAELNKLLNIVHNVPSFIDGTHMLGFDGQWFVKALGAFDARNGTQFATIYERALTEK
jgi:hypothetical protein